MLRENVARLEQIMTRFRRRRRPRLSDEELIAVARTAANRIHKLERQRNREKTKAMREQMLRDTRIIRCHYCGKMLTADLATIDHVKPISKGGLTERRNCVWACSPCNHRKGDS